MKAIQPLWLIMLVTALLGRQCEKESPYLEFSDEVFLQVLLEIGVDFNGDGLISKQEAEQITSLDVTDKGLTDLSNNTELGTEEWYVSYNQLNGIYLTDMPSLVEVCVWELPFPPEGVEVDTTGSPNVYFTTDCTSAK